PSGRRDERAGTACYSTAEANNADPLPFQELRKIVRSGLARGDFRERLRDSRTASHPQSGPGRKTGFRPDGVAQARLVPAGESPGLRAGHSRPQRTDHGALEKDEQDAPRGAQREPRAISNGPDLHPDARTEEGLLGYVEPRRSERTPGSHTTVGSDPATRPYEAALVNPASRLRPASRGG